MTDRVWMAAEIVAMIEVVEPFQAQSYLEVLILPDMGPLRFCGREVAVV
jgi:hypothetical protein